MTPAQEIEIAKGFIDALNNIGNGLHAIADAMRQGPEDIPSPFNPQYLDQGAPKGGE